MINWRDCIVPDIKLRNHVYVWVAYSKDYPYLPIAVADTAQKLADMTGTTKQTVISAWCHYKNGATESTRYHRVKTGYSPEKGE